MRISGRTKLDKERVECPYRGLMPFTEKDEQFFFGRNADTKILTANLIASRLTIVYGPTGVGKSSVLRAGVVSALYKSVESNLAGGFPPELLPVYFNAWSQYPGNATKGLLHALEESSVRIGLKTSTSPPHLQIDRAGGKGGSLCVEAQLRCEDADGPLLLILDQFEEYFLYNTTGSDFENELVSLLLNPNIKANCVLSIREDALALLDKFKGKLPFLLDNILRLNYLDRTEGREAISRPIEALNQSIKDQKQLYSVEPELIETVLDDVSTGKLLWEDETINGTFLGKEENDARSADTRELLSHREIADTIETPFLQIVMTKIWDKEVEGGSHVLRLYTLQHLKGARAIVQSHVSDALSRMTTRRQKATYRCFRYLATPSGTKIALNAHDLADFTGMKTKKERKIVDEALKELSSVRLLRPVADKYEIYHDILAPAILDWRRRYLNARRFRLLRASVAIALCILLPTSVYFVYKVREQARASQALKARQAQFHNGLSAFDSAFDSIQANQYKSALEQLTQAETDTGYQASPFMWNNLCWKGALAGEAELVQPACERAVAANPNSGHYLDSRGLDRALVGNREGAIQDFRRVVTDETMPEYQRKERNVWLQALQKGKNPFTPEVIAALSKE